MVDGSYIDEETITCQTPNFEAHGAQEVDLKVNINGSGWTVNKINFQYFLNTYSKNCLAYGPGLLNNVLFGIEMNFTVQAFDTSGAKRSSGGDEFEVKVISHDEKHTGLCTVTDNKDGTYSVLYTTPAPGEYLIYVTHLDLGEKRDWGNIRGSPFRVHCQDPWTRNRMIGNLPSLKKGTSLNCMAGNLIVLNQGEPGLHLCEVHDQVTRRSSSP